jgi:hypothetical protein
MKSCFWYISLLLKEKELSVSCHFQQNFSYIVAVSCWKYYHSQHIRYNTNFCILFKNYLKYFFYLYYYISFSVVFVAELTKWLYTEDDLLSFLCLVAWCRLPCRKCHSFSPFRRTSRWDNDWERGHRKRNKNQLDRRRIQPSSLQLIRSVQDEIAFHDSWINWEFVD